MKQKQTIDEVTKILGYKYKDCPAITRAMELVGEGYRVLGVWRGTWRYTGKITQARIRRMYPDFCLLEPLAFGSRQGEDRIAILGV